MPEKLHSIRYPFAIDEGLGTLMEEQDFAQHVEQLILQVLFTNPGERINRPDFGCGLRRMVFAPNSDTTASLLQITVLEALDRWLSSVISVEDLQIRAIEERLEVKIVYILIARQQRRFLNLEVNL